LKLLKKSGLRYCCENLIACNNNKLVDTFASETHEAKQRSDSKRNHCSKCFTGNAILRMLTKLSI
jgi:hypothetical protein